MSRLTSASMTSRPHAGLDWSGVLHDMGDLSTNGVYRGPRGTVTRLTSTI